MGKGVFPNFGGQKVFWKFFNPERHFLGPNRVFWRIERENRFSGLGCILIHEPKKKTKKNATEDEHVGHVPGKNPPADFF